MNQMSSAANFRLALKPPLSALLGDAILGDVLALSDPRDTPRKQSTRLLTPGPFSKHSIRSSYTIHVSPEGQIPPYPGQLNNLVQRDRVGRIV